MTDEGLGGALLIGIGGTILFVLYYEFMSNVYSHVFAGTTFDPVIIVIIFSFLGFMILGLGLGLIVQSGKPKPHQNPS
jgi:membrane-bound metal-dependent hydrolase YbcI (DUF457 family)